MAAQLAPASRLHVAGIDISLTGTGLATTMGTLHIPTTGKRGDTLVQRHHRFQHISRRLFDELGECDLAVVEDPAFGAPGGSTWDRGGLWWLIIDGLLDREIPVALVSPKTRAKYATGSGSAGKAAVVEATNRRYGVQLTDDNEADALVLRAMGHDWAGLPLAPAPELNRTALLSCQWPSCGLQEVSR
ncbi:hypothetical protein [Kitasatospora purpeofusca]|uniref:hypothetical protein n=1 Tax=Kitasatospora purpeofusca TaxID=67352 RepID=UPI003656BBB8